MYIKAFLNLFALTRPEFRDLHLDNHASSVAYRLDPELYHSLLCCHLFANWKHKRKWFLECLHSPSYSRSNSWAGVRALISNLLPQIKQPTFFCYWPLSRYVDAGTSAKENLTYASGDHFVLRADFKKTLNPSGPGRDSVRLQSKKKYTKSVMVWVWKRSLDFFGSDREWYRCFCFFKF